MGKKRILMIDDDNLPMQYYITQLEKHRYEVKYFIKPDDAFRYIDNEKPHIDGIILDIMLPPGEKYKDTPTNQGLKTGVFVLRDLRAYPEYSSVPVIILTNVRNPTTLAEFVENDLLKIAFKPDYPPLKLIELLKTTYNLSPI